jgi:hypothetical protein
MPLHDWTRVPAHAYHDFHTAWLVAVRNALNAGVLPAGFYARSEQSLRPMGPDVLTLQAADRPAAPSPGVAATTTPPQVRFAAAATARPVGFRQKRLAVRHASGDRLIAVVELVSPGNKASRPALKQFVAKVVRAVDAGVSAVVADPFPPTRRDPDGLPGLIWPALGGEAFELPADKPLTFAGYEAGGPVPKCYVEVAAIGDRLPDVPLFLEPGRYVNVPFEAAYAAAWEHVLPQDRAALTPGTPRP